MSSSDRNDPVVAKIDMIFEPSLPFALRLLGTVPSCSSSMLSRCIGLDELALVGVGPGSCELRLRFLGEFVNEAWLGDEAVDDGCEWLRSGRELETRRPEGR